ncbi:MAG: PHP domain-containing protein [Bariatricus sp.]
MNSNKIFKNPDLHMHSIYSDGTDTPSSLLQKVKAAGIDLFSLTDHDSCDGCVEMQKVLQPDDPAFIYGVEFSCRDGKGKYHILGYGYDPEKSSIIEAVQITHSARLDKAKNRLKYLEDQYGFVFSEEEQNEFFALENPGKPHLAKMMLARGYVTEKSEAFRILGGYHGKERYLSPEEAIDAILFADGIPVLAHGILADGSKVLTEEETEERISRLKVNGLMGVECYYSGFTDLQKNIMLKFAETYNLFVTAGSDYHGANKTVKIGNTNQPSPEVMQRFYKALSRLL